MPLFYYVSDSEKDTLQKPLDAGISYVEQLRGAQFADSDSNVLEVSGPQLSEPYHGYPFGAAANQYAIY